MRLHSKGALRRAIKAGIMNELSGIKRFRLNKRKAVPDDVGSSESILVSKFKRAIPHTYSNYALWLICVTMESVHLAKRFHSICNYLVTWNDVAM